MNRRPGIVAGCLLAGLLAPVPGQAGKGNDNAPIELEVALVNDGDFPPLAPELIERSFESARRTFAERFDANPPTFRIKGRYEVSEFMTKYARADDLRCARLFGARYLGGGVDELRQYKKQAIRFWERWPLESLKGFLGFDDRPAVTSYEDLYDVYERRYVDTVRQIQRLKTPKGTPLATPSHSRSRSYVAWTCALGLQNDYDVVITNTFILADLLSEPHPHSVFGKAKIGGIAGPSKNREALGGQALLVTTFGIDTKQQMLSELRGRPASLQERADMLGSYLLAHEIAHAVFGIPDVFDHPPGCLMTSRPGETYRDGLTELRANPGPCPRCRDWVRARAAYDLGRTQAAAGNHRAALRTFAQAAKVTPKHFHGGYKKKIGEMSVEVSRSYAALGNQARARRFARSAVKLDPKSEEARRQLELVTKKASVEVASSPRNLPVPNGTKTSSTSD